MHALAAIHRSLVFGLVFGLVVLVPGAALACPNCALRENTPGRWFVLVGMILLPWTVVGLTVLAIRRTMKNEQLEEG